MKRVVIVGGGISGLAAAWAATGGEDERRRGLQVSVLERDTEVGGKARSLASDGWLVEAGPTACFGDEPVLEHLIDAAGLSEQRVEADEAAARRFLVRGGRMREVHTHPLRFARSGLLGWRGMLRLAREPFVAPYVGDWEESVWSFAKRRIGAQGADRLIAPMVLGIFAGDAKRLSLKAAFPKLASLEREHGSLFKGMLAKRKERRAGGPAGRGGRLTSFPAGLQTLPLALANKGRFHVRTGAEVQALLPRPGGGYRVAVRGDAETIPADAVILAGEPWASATLLRAGAPSSAGLADLLGGISCPPLAIVGLGFGAESLRRVPRGFGVLIPRGEGFRILGCLWDTHLFAGRSPDGCLLLRAMVGGAVDPAAALLPEGELLSMVRDDLKRLLGVTETPRFQRVIRWPAAIPQYEIGHLARVRAIEEQLERQPGLFLAGNAVNGVAFDRAATAGFRCGQRALEALTGQGASDAIQVFSPATTGPLERSAARRAAIDPTREGQ